MSDLINILKLKIFPNTFNFSCEWQVEYHSDYKKQLSDFYLRSFYQNIKNDDIKQFDAKGGGIYLIIRKEEKDEKLRIYVGRSRENAWWRISQNLKKAKNFFRIYLLQNKDLFKTINHLFWFEKELIKYFSEKHSNFICDNQNKGDYQNSHPKLKEIFLDVLKILQFFEPKIQHPSLFSPSSKTETQSYIKSPSSEKIPPSFFKANDILSDSFFPNIFILKGKIQKGGQYFACGLYSKSGKNLFK